MVSTSPDLLDADAFAALPDEGRLDLIRGEVLRMPPAGGEHGSIGARVIGRLLVHVEERGLGEIFTSETGFLLARDPDTVLAPDAAFIRTERLPEPEKWQKFIELAPDLVVEVVSPSDRSDDVNKKVVAYLEAGVQLVWIIHPAPQTVTIYTPDHRAEMLMVNDQLTGGDVLPDFSTSIRGLFPHPFRG